MSLWDNLEARWRFVDNFNDDIGLRTGINNGSILVNPSGALFNGSSHIESSGTSLNFDEFSIAVWIFTQSLTNWENNGIIDDINYGNVIYSNKYWNSDLQLCEGYELRVPGFPQSNLYTETSGNIVSRSAIISNTKSVLIAPADCL